MIAATHRNLGQMVKAGLFREDLYYRLNVLSLDLPPLRERDGDLPLLAQYFLNRFHRRGSAPTRVSSAAWSALSAFDFPGNVRQLGHAIEHAIVMAGDGEIEPRHLPAEITAGPGAVTIPRPSQTLHVAKQEFEREYMRHVLDHSDGKPRGGEQDPGDLSQASLGDVACIQRPSFEMKDRLLHFD